MATTESWWKRKRSGRPVCGLQRALNLATHDGQCFTVGTIPQFPSPSPAPNPFSRKIPPVAVKKILQRSHGLSLSMKLPRRFFLSGLERGVYQICLRRHYPKGVSAGAAGNQPLPKPALEAQGNKSQLLGPPPCIELHSLQAPIPLVILPFSETPLLPILPS